MSSSNAAPFLAARDFLLRHREDYATAYRDFEWPKLDRFNWALDYFDVMARDNAQPALWLVDEDAGETQALVRATERALEPCGQCICADSACAAATVSCSCSATSSRCGNACWRR